MSVAIVSPLDASGNVKISGNTFNGNVTVTNPSNESPNSAWQALPVLPAGTTTGAIPNVVVALETIPTYLPENSVFGTGVVSANFPVAGCNYNISAGTYVVQYDLDFVLFENAASGANFGFNGTLVIGLLPLGATSPTIVTSNPSTLTWVTAPKAPLCLVLEQVSDRSVTGLAITPAACKHYKAKGSTFASLSTTVYTVSANLFVTTDSNLGGSYQGNLVVNVLR